MALHERVKCSSRMPAGSHIEAVVTRYYMEVADTICKAEDVKDGLDLSKHRSNVVHYLLEDESFREALMSSLKLAEELQKARAKALADSMHDVLIIYFTLASPGLVGAGSGPFKPVFEVGMEIDRLLGLPYYPGSSVKGSARTVCEHLLSDNQDLAGKVCGSLYGSPGEEGRVGAVIHGPMLPVGCVEELGPCTVYWGDVTTPHYYQGGRVVEAEVNAMPKPVVHLSISPGTVFLGYLALPREARSYAAEAAQHLAESGEQGGVPGALVNHAHSGPLWLAAVFAVSGFLSSLGARSGKGYNEPDPERTGAASHDSNIESLVHGFQRIVKRVRFISGRR